MKLNKIAAGIAAASALAAGQAMAFGPTTTPDMDVWVSGASAEDKALGQLFTDLCTDALDTYYDTDTATLGAHYRAFFCTVDATTVPGLSAPTKVLFHKRSAGGSGYGVAPVADATAIDQLAITPANCTETAAGSHEWHCGAALVQQASDAGISDVEPALFVAPNVEAGFLPVTPDQLAKLNVTSATGVIFNTPVSLALRNALQQAQFGMADPCVGAETEACMPSLSREQIASLFTGGVKKWDAFKVNGVSLTNTTVVSTAPTDLKVHICRRVPGSGTQAQFNAQFTQTPCAAGAIPPLETSNPFAGPIVVLNSGSGDVENCLDAADAAGQWAIGIQSTEKNTSLSHAYRFIKVDGVAPTLVNAADNKYFDWVENSIQWRNAANAGPSGDKLVLLQKISSDAGKPSIVANLNAGFVHTWGAAGYLALNTNGSPAFTPSTPFDPANPVATATHAFAGSVNNCRVPTVNKNSEL